MCPTFNVQHSLWPQKRPVRSKWKLYKNDIGFLKFIRSLEFDGFLKNPLCQLVVIPAPHRMRGRNDSIFNFLPLHQVLSFIRGLPIYLLTTTLGTPLLDLPKMIGQIIKMDGKIHIFHQTIFRLSHLDRGEIENRPYAGINKPLRNGLGL